MKTILLYAAVVEQEAVESDEIKDDCVSTVWSKFEETKSEIVEKIKSQQDI